MGPPERQTPHCRVYRAGGAEPLEVESPVCDLPYRAPVMDRTWLPAIMSRRLVCGQRDLTVAAIARLMREHRVGCLPIVDDEFRPIGVVTKADLLAQLDMRSSRGNRRCEKPARADRATAADLMTQQPFTLTERATVAEAMELMIRNFVHHVLVVSETRMLVGVVSTQDVVEWLFDHDHAASPRFATKRPMAWHPDDG
jgi:CBS domain-containing protein